MNDTTKNQALKFAMKLIGLRKRSVFEIEKRLKRKRFGDSVIEEVMLELNKFKYLNDEDFTQSYINDRIKFRPCGRFLLKKELTEKGISEGTIERKVNELYGEEKELELAEYLVTKKLQIIGNVADKDKTYHKIFSYLQSKGFASSVIGQALENKIK